jgi:hypothetical protein
VEVHPCRITTQVQMYTLLMPGRGIASQTGIAKTPSAMTAAVPAHVKSS